MDVFRSARQNLRRHGEADTADLERQQSREAQEMNGPQARPSPISNVLRRIADLPRSSSRQPRQASSRYDSSITGEIVSPKTPQFAGSMPNMPNMQSMPSLQRLEMRQGGANGPIPSRLSQPPSYDDASLQYHEVTVPAAAVAAQRVRSRSAGSQASDRSERRRQQRRFDGADPAELHLADMAEDGRRRRRRRSQLQEQMSSSASAKAQPKKFLFCFPYVRSHQMRAQILRCSVSALLLVLLVTMYLSLMLTHNIRNNEFSVLLVLMALALFVFFCHSLVRIILLLVRPPSLEEEERYRQRRARAAGGGSPAGPGSGPFPYGTDLFTPGGYAIPRQPIRVVLARDEEAAGVESVAAKTQPPAYGLWRETVRVDPNRIYWQRNNEAPPRTAGGEENNNNNNNNNTSNSSHSRSVSSSSSSSSSSNSRSEDGSNSRSISNTEDGARQDSRRESSGAATVRPPSYASEDGVSYVVEAQPRSIAPTTEVPTLTHPSEVGRRGQPADM